MTPAPIPAEPIRWRELLPQVKRAMSALAVSQKELAARAGVSTATISRYLDERFVDDQRNHDTVIAICNALGLNAARIPIVAEAAQKPAKPADPVLTEIRAMREESGNVQLILERLAAATSAIATAVAQNADFMRRFLDRPPETQPNGDDKRPASDSKLKRLPRRG